MRRQSSYGGYKLDHFSPTLIKNGPIGSKDLLLTNPRNENRAKRSCVYPENWSEFACDLKALEVIMSSKNIIKMSENFKSLNITGYTSEGLEIKICYDILTKRIKTHHPLI